MKKKHLLLLALVLIAFLMRVVKITQLPAILNRDEAALAYNAFLLKETGKDEWGRNWPMTLESFGDYKLPGYPYILSLLFYVLPMNDLVVRLPSILAGTALVAISYFLLQQLKFKQQAAFLFALLINFGYVFFFYSRMAWEANLALALYLVFLLFLLKKNNARNTIISLISLILAIFIYNSPLIILPFIIITVPFIKSWRKIKNWLPMVLILSIIFMLSCWRLTAISQQKSGITIFTDETVWANHMDFRQNLAPWQQMIFGSQYFYWATIIIKNIFRSFTYEFLVAKGGSHPWHIIPHFAHLNHIVYTAALIGIFYSLFKIIVFWKNKLLAKTTTNNQHTFPKKLEKRNLWLIYLLLVSLIPAAITVDAPHATRSLLFFYLLNIFAIEGILLTGEFLKSKFFKNRFTKQKFERKFFLIVAALFLLESSCYFYAYFTKYPDSQYTFKAGFDQTIQKVEQKYPNKEVAVVGDSYQYILLAWYLKLEPSSYFSSVVRQLPDKIGIRYGERVTHYHFIAHRDDRVETEKILVEWQGRQWQIEEK